VNQSTSVNIEVYNTQGVKIETIYNQSQLQPGGYSITHDLRIYKPGLYNVILKTNYDQKSLKLVKM
jgi:hypothetical protein